MLRCSKHILLAQEVGAEGLRIQSLTNLYDENVFEYFFGYRHYLKKGTNFVYAN